MRRFSIDKFRDRPFGRLSVIADSGRRTKGRGVVVTCQCACGVIKDIALDALVRGATVSCGCEGAKRRCAAAMARTRKLSPVGKETAVALYASGLGGEEIGRRLGVAGCSIRSVLSVRGVNRREQSQAQRLHTGHTLNESVFGTLNEESEYWLGFLAADGAVVNRTVALVLHERDERHLEKFRRFVGGSQAIVKPREDTRRYAFQSRRVADALATYGVTERKSKTLTPTQSLCSSRHFWRGMIDGDGSLGLRKDGIQRLELCGSLPAMTLFLAFIKANGIATEANVNVMKSIFRVQLTGRFAVECIFLLYNNATVALDRKMEKANVAANGARGVFLRALGDHPLRLSN